jgi:hypothetical protein
MPRFLVFHHVPGGIAQDTLVADAKKVLNVQSAALKWLNSWYSPAEERLYCEWEAPDAEALGAAIARGGSKFPVEAIHEVEWVDPDWFDQA